MYISIVVPFVLYGCETWSATLTVGHKLRAFEDSDLRELSGPERDRGSDRSLRLHYLYRSSRRMRWAGHVARMGEKKCLYVFMGKPEGKTPFGRHWHRWHDCN